MQEKSLSAQQLFADITVTELCDRFMPSAGDAMRRRDIIRARVTSTEPMVRATTKEDASLGVLHALCTACGAPLLADDAVPDFNVSCSRCDYTGYRVLSSDFNNLNGLDPSLLNEKEPDGPRKLRICLATMGQGPTFPVADHREVGPMKSRKKRFDQDPAKEGTAQGGRCMRLNAHCAALTQRFLSNQQQASRLDAAHA